MEAGKKTRHCGGLASSYLHLGTLQGSSLPARSQRAAWSRRSWNARLHCGHAGFVPARRPHAARCLTSWSTPRRTPSSHREASASSSRPSPAHGGDPSAKTRSRRAMASLSCRYTCWDARSCVHLCFLCHGERAKTLVETDVFPVSRM
jgi:hypothetical protein